MTDEIRIYHVDDPNDAPERRLGAFPTINPFLPTSLTQYVIPPVENSLRAAIQYYWYSAYQQGVAAQRQQQQHQQQQQQQQQLQLQQLHSQSHVVAAAANLQTLQPPPQTNETSTATTSSFSSHPPINSPDTSSTTTSASANARARPPSVTTTTSNNQHLLQEPHHDSPQPLSAASTAQMASSSSSSSSSSSLIDSHSPQSSHYDHDHSNHNHHRHLHRSNSVSSVEQEQHQRKQQHEHIKKPLNPFMIFMQKQRPEIVRQGVIKESAAINQLLGQQWRKLSREEQEPYYKLAEQEKLLHAQKYPGWSARDNYANQKKRKKLKLKSISLNGLDQSDKKCRARFGLGNMASWCKPCKRKKKCIYSMPRHRDRSNGHGNNSSNLSRDNPNDTNVSAYNDSHPHLSSYHHPHQHLAPHNHHNPFHLAQPPLSHHPLSFQF